MALEILCEEFRTSETCRESIQMLNLGTSRFVASRCGQIRDLSGSEPRDEHLKKWLTGSLCVALIYFGVQNSYMYERGKVYSEWVVQKRGVLQLSTPLGDLLRRTRCRKVWFWPAPGRSKSLDHHSRPKVSYQTR